MAAIAGKSLMAVLKSVIVDINSISNLSRRKSIHFLHISASHLHLILQVIFGCRLFSLSITHSSQGCLDYFASLLYVNMANPYPSSVG